jgi:hypothetical protein
MPQTQFFTRQDFGIDIYKSDFKKALDKVKIVNLFSAEVIDFLSTWIDAQTSYIPRTDIDNFLANMDLIYADKDFYDFVVNRQQSITSNGKINEYSFNLISNLDDSKVLYEKSQSEKNKKEELKNDEQIMKNEDRKRLDEIEKMLQL